MNKSIRNIIRIIALFFIGTLTAYVSQLPFWKHSIVVIMICLMTVISLDLEFK